MFGEIKLDFRGKIGHMNSTTCSYFCYLCDLILIILSLLQKLIY